jgi:hypothetical protein
MPPGGIAGIGDFGSGFSATIASVVIRSLGDRTLSPVGNCSSGPYIKSSPPPSTTAGRHLSG